MRHTLGLIVLAAGVQACASQSSYIPEQRATDTLSGRTAAAYAVPSEQYKQGDVRLASFGVTKLKTNGDDSLKAFHLRVSLSDIGSQPIVLDTRRQSLELPDGRRIAAAYVRSRVSAPPLILVQPGSAQIVDLYFPVPRDLIEESSPPQFDVVWNVQVGRYTVSQITPFDKVAVDPAEARLEEAEESQRDIYVVGPAGASPPLGLPMGGGI
jgi:hypothetical protein